jgi:hypothetical protein
MHDIQKLEMLIKGLQGVLGELGDEAELESLLKIIHGPGWTTLPEYTFVVAITESMTAHARALVSLKQALMEGSRAIGQTGE